MSWLRRFIMGVPSPTLEKVEFDGSQRRILTYGGGQGQPIIVMLHPFTTRVEACAALIEAEWVRAQGFTVVLPEALPALAPRWDDSVIEEPVNLMRGIPDVPFIKYVIDRAMERYATAEVFIAGYSNGAFMCNRLLHELHDYGIKAQFQVAGALLNPYTTNVKKWYCTKIPTLMVNGTADKRVAYNGSTGVQPVPSSAAYYMSKWNLPIMPVIYRLPERTPDDGTSTKVHSWSVDGLAITKLYTVEGGGHTWPVGSRVNKNLATEGKVSKDFSATELMVEWFKSHR